MQTIATIAGCITGVSAAAVLVWRTVVWFDRIVDGVKCQLRTEITRVYYQYSSEKKIPEYEYEACMLNYQAYRNLGGNSFITKLKSDIEQWEVIR